MVLTDQSTKVGASLTSAQPTVAGSPAPVEIRNTRAKGKDVDLESAVYAHIQALRALGKTRVNTAEIAKALGISVAQVDRTIASLSSKGVKLAK